MPGPVSLTKILSTINSSDGLFARIESYTDALFFTIPSRRVP